MRIGSNDALPEVAHMLQFTDANENIMVRQEWQQSLFREPEAPVNPSVQTRSRSGTL